MPDGKTHETINTIVLLALLSGFCYIASEQNIAALRELDTTFLIVFTLGYTFATFFLSPDLDIKSKPYKRWGILRLFWWPYKVIFRHRGYSHHPVIGPISIILNLAIIVALFFRIGGYQVQSIPPDIIIPATAGMIVSMEVHIISDSFVSKLKHIL